MPRSAAPIHPIPAAVHRQTNPERSIDGPLYILELAQSESACRLLDNQLDDDLLSQLDLKRAFNPESPSDIESASPSIS